MIIRDVLDVISKERRTKKRIKAVQKLAVGMSFVAAVGGATGILLAPKSGKEIRGDLKKKAVNAMDSIKVTVQKKDAAVKDFVTHVAQEVSHIKDVPWKNESVKKDSKNGYNAITKDIDNTSENVESEINRSVLKTM